MALLFRAAKQVVPWVHNLAFQSGKSMAEVEVPGPPAKVQKISLEKENGLHHNGVSVAAPPALQVKRLSEKAVLPSRGSAFAAGYDLSSAYDDVVPARGKALIKTDLSIAIPEGSYGRVAPRSGLAWKHSIDVGAGVVDSDYRGPLSVILFNFSDVDFTINAGDRVAQLVLERIITPDVVEVEELSTTVRGEGGFGSTGVAVTVTRS